MLFVLAQDRTSCVSASHHSMVSTTMDMTIPQHVRLQCNVYDLQSSKGQPASKQFSAEVPVDPKDVINSCSWFQVACMLLSPQHNPAVHMYLT